MQKFEPINQSKFTPETSRCNEEYNVYKKIVHAKKPNSSVPGDLPKKVVKAFDVELAIRATTLNTLHTKLSCTDLVRLLHFIHARINRSTPHAVVLALVDLSKAFNRVDHCLVIEDIHDMKVPAWLLKILISYLTHRTMVVKFKGATSSIRSLPGSCPQGVFLGCFFFMIKVNGALLRPDIPRSFPIPVPIIQDQSSSCTQLSILMMPPRPESST